MTLISSARGMRDLLPNETCAWRRVEKVAADCFALYGYGEIRTPIVERLSLFQRQLGEHTDVVQKEMYAFAERSSDEYLCLRPEATVPTVRAVVAAALYRGDVARVWYGGQMFRHERPQKGRYRQFWQLGAEAIGTGASNPAIDVEQILMSARLWKMLGIDNQVALHINNLGSIEERALYRRQLSDYFNRYQTRLDEASKSRINTNPLRILDSKDAQTMAVAHKAPPAPLGKESQAYGDAIKSMLAAADVDFIESPTLVRGLDYYNLTVFEWVMKDDTRRQNALCGGGRYDGLSSQIGGPPLSGCGFALGLDRLVALVNSASSEVADCFIVTAGAHDDYIMQVAEHLRSQGISVWRYYGGGNVARQLKKADAMNVSWAIVIGEREEAAQTITIKYLRNGEQKTATLSEAITIMKDMQGKINP